ncbi:hypothetical protein TH63_09360 [Rufibacter radiotolerans]|uniref:Uncharacterized protein n=1 Tax=Rufibacter radiotolerans TaxID=1379910 RepID=A0A0H4VPD8_9BACT|nr:hypothetical protein [Rufibacter radiotolerans]AKQ45802.1 hypothetical protein TH63_09360 [Rufibacter radiotolerans]
MNIDQLIEALKNDHNRNHPVMRGLREEIVKYEYFQFVMETCLDLARNDLDTLSERIHVIKIMEGDVYPSSKYFSEFLESIQKADNLRVLIESLEEAKVKGSFSV